MALTQPALIPQPWGSDGQVGNIPQDSSEFGKASWAKGFPTETSQPLSEGGIPPSYLDFQGVLNALSAHAVFMQSGAHFSWSNALDYPAGCFVLGSDGKLYQALLASGPGYSAGAKNPTTSAAHWQIANFAEYLKTSGGTMSGPIVFANGGSVQRTNQPYKGTLVSGAGEMKVWLLDPDSQLQPGQILLRCDNGNGTANDLVLNFEQDIKWKGLSVLTAADSATIAGYVMPSGSTYGLEIGASGTVYTMAKTGWLFIDVPYGDSNYGTLRNETQGYQVNATSNLASGQQVLLPVIAGDRVSLYYNVPPSFLILFASHGAA